MVFEDISFTGADVAFTLLPEGYQFRDSVGDVVQDIGRGAFLSTGGGLFPEDGVIFGSHDLGRPGVEFLTQAATEAFPNVSTTRDAAYITIAAEVTLPGDGSFYIPPSVDFELVFVSNEYPSYVDSAYVDIAGVWVNGENYAVFNSDASQPIAVTSQTVFSEGNWFSNAGGNSGSYDVPFNGFSRKLNITAPLQDGANEIVIAIADTGDGIVDSGLFIGDLSVGDADDFGAFVLIDVLKDLDLGALSLTLAPEIVNLRGSGTMVTGTPLQLNGDVLKGWSDEARIEVRDVFFSIDDLTIIKGSAILEIDTDGDGMTDTTIKLEGNYEHSEFIVTQTATGTEITTESVGQWMPGTSGNDLLVGGMGNDTIWSHEGNDVIYATGGDNLIGSGEGNDTIHGGWGNDTIWAGPGDDVIFANGGDNLIGGGPGNDTIYGGDGNDTIWAGPGDDMVFSGGGDNVIGVGPGSDTLVIDGDGDNLVYGGQADADGVKGSNAITVAGRGNNEIFNGIGDDKVILASGADGDNLLWGGKGNDLFDFTDATTRGTVAFVDGNGHDTLRNFDLAADHFVDFSGMPEVFGTVTDVHSAMTEVVGGTVIVVSATQSVQIDVAAAELIAADPGDWLIL